MSIRHNLRVYDKEENKLIFNTQIVGNNDFFDVEFYKVMNLTLSEESTLEETEIDIIDFMAEYWKYLERHPEKKGLFQAKDSPFMTKEELLKNNRLIALNLTANYYESALYILARDLFDFLIDADINIKKPQNRKYKTTLKIN